MAFFNPNKVQIPVEQCERYRAEIEEYSKESIISEKVTDGKRHYTVPGGNVYPSVTTVISSMSDKTWIKEWQDRVGIEVAEEITRKAAARGSSLHDMNYNHLKGNKIDINGLGYPMFKKMKIYLQHITPLGLEIPLWSDRLKIAGRTDCIGYYKGALSIIDYKTARREKTPDQILNYFQQSAFYSMMLIERINIAAKKIVILIGVDDGFPQEFVRDVNTYIKDNIVLSRNYHELHHSR